MFKFTLVAVVALMSLQLSSGASFGLRNNLEDAVELYAEAARQLEHIQEFIAKHIASIAREFEFKIQTVLEESEIDPIIEELRNNITEIESSIDESQKSCTAAAWTSTVLVTEETKKSIDACISNAREVEAQLKATSESVDGKSVNLSDELVNGLNQCLIIENDDEKVTCLLENIGPITDKVNLLDEEVKTVHHDANHVFNEGVRHLRKCLQDVRHDLQAKSESIISTLNECIQPETTTTTTTTIVSVLRNQRGIMDIFRELKEKIEYIINLVSNLPHSIEEIPDKINEIIAHLNLKYLVSKLKSEVNTIINEGGKNAETCRPSATEKLNNLTTKSEMGLKQCLNDAQDSISALQDKVHALAEEGKNLLSNMNSKVLKCVWDNKLNPSALYTCLKESAEEFKQKAAELQEKVSDFLANVGDNSLEIINVFSECAGNIQVNLIQEGQQILKETEECVKFA